MTAVNYNGRPPDASEIFTKAEMWRILCDLKRRAERADEGWMKLCIFRLACCCGLRASEICGVQVKDFVFSPNRPVLRVRGAIAKSDPGGRVRPRVVPLWWDTGTRNDLKAWTDMRHACDGPSATLVTERTSDKPTTRQNLLRMWHEITKSLGPVRSKQVSVKGGRKTFISHALAVGQHQRSLAEVRLAAGHSTIATTSLYLNVLDGYKTTEIFGDDSLHTTDEDREMFVYPEFVDVTARTLARRANDLRARYVLLSGNRLDGLSKVEGAVSDAQRKVIARLEKELAAERLERCAERYR